MTVGELCGLSCYLLNDNVRGLCYDAIFGPTHRPLRPTDRLVNKRRASAWSISRIAKLTTHARTHPTQHGRDRCDTSATPPRAVGLDNTHRVQTMTASPAQRRTVQGPAEAAGDGGGQLHPGTRPPRRQPARNVNGYGRLPASAKTLDGGHMTTHGHSSGRTVYYYTGERDNARNNARCTQARKATHGLDGQHQDVDRTLRGRVNQNDRGQR